ncbi:Lrp/AsnC family transcriptional regulator [Kribbella sp. CA-253562]|uniref:Lrp/AsnC family transcriptional regulator n=1 Tax=Kribbella sp. CA-253562 TaxID=3239942 RepID=UPI003D945564
MTVDDVDRRLLALLQEDATRSYAVLGEAVGLSAGAAHERVRKLRASGVIRRTTVEVDPAALGRGVLAYVLLDADAWMGDRKTALEAIEAVEEAHVIAGPASVLVKVRTGSTEELQQTLRMLHQVDGVTSTQTVVVLESFFERPSAVV